MNMGRNLRNQLKMLTGLQDMLWVMGMQCVSVCIESGDENGFIPLLMSSGSFLIILV